jgi:hypothetical protein
MPYMVIFESNRHHPKSGAEDSHQMRFVFLPITFFKVRRLRECMANLRRFLVGRASAALMLLRAVRVRDVPWLLLGLVAMILISPDEECSKPIRPEELARRRNASPKKP